MADRLAESLTGASCGDCLLESAGLDGGAEAVGSSDDVAFVEGAGFGGSEEFGLDLAAIAEGNFLSDEDAVGVGRVGRSGPGGVAGRVFDGGSEQAAAAIAGGTVGPAAAAGLAAGDARLVANELFGAGLSTESAQKAVARDEDAGVGEIGGRGHCG